MKCIQTYICFSIVIFAVLGGYNAANAQDYVDGELILWFYN